MRWKEGNEKPGSTLNFKMQKEKKKKSKQSAALVQTESLAPSPINFPVLLDLKRDAAREQLGLIITGVRTAPCSACTREMQISGEHEKGVACTFRTA